jgi:hypothetical protein
LDALFAPFISQAPPADPSVAVQNAATQAQDAISACQRDDLQCLADALDAYAEALRELSPALPPPLRKLPDIISKAARGVRTAKTKGQAVRAIKVAIAEVNKAISLLNAGDSFTLSVQTREGTLVEQTLEVASAKLEKATGL